jgi:betaine-aldehyde dehydrogenase
MYKRTQAACSREEHDVKDLYIGGKWDASGSGATSQTLNPLDASVLETVAEASPDDVERAITAAREALERGSWRRTSAAQRDQTLAEARTDVDDAAEVFSYYAGIADAHVGRVVDPGKPNVASRIVHEPVGVCALITPWDYPLPQMSWKLAPPWRRQHRRGEAE